MDIFLSLSHYQSLLNEYPESFEYEIEYIRKWNAIPQDIKDKYYEEPINKLYFTLDEDMPEVIKKWPGILSATDEDWKIHNEYYNSEKYKLLKNEENKLRAETYNRYFSKYGFTKSPSDF